MSTLFVFGAGASAFSGENTVSPASPPLGNNLFDSMREWVLFSELNENIKEAFSTISDELTKEFRNNFEIGMARMIGVGTAHIKQPLQFLKGMAAYFLHFELNHSPLYKNKNFYIKLISNLLKTKKSYVFSSLNYEMLLEDAIGYCNIPLIYYGLPQETSILNSGIKLIKPHGASNFYMDSQIPLHISEISFVTSMTDEDGNIVTDCSNVMGVPIGGNVKPVTKLEAKNMAKNDNLAHSPVMSNFMIGKHTSMCANFVLEQRQLFKKAVFEAKRILIIGIHVNLADDHIWQPLAETDGHIGYVSPEREQFTDWAYQNRRRKKSGVVEKTFGECFSGNSFSKAINRFFEDKFPYNL